MSFGNIGNFASGDNALNAGKVRAGKFDGIADAVDTGLNVGFTGDFTFKAVVRTDENITSQCTILGESGDGIRIASNKFQYRNFTNGNVTIQHSTTIAQNQFYTLEASRSGTTVTLTVDGSAQTGTDSAQGNVGGNIEVGSRTNSRTQAMTVKSIEYSDTVSGINYNFNSYFGTTTVFDLSGNGNHGTVATGSGGLSSFWVTV